MTSAAHHEGLQFSVYWNWEPTQKFTFLEKNIDESTQSALRLNLADEVVYARNRKIWSHCKSVKWQDPGAKKRICVGDLSRHFGVDEGNLGRALKGGKASDQMLAYALSIVGIDPSLWVISPRQHHITEGLACTVKTFRHRCEVAKTEWVKVSTRPALGMHPDEARLPAIDIPLHLAALMRALNTSQETLETWIYLAASVSQDLEDLDQYADLLDFVDEIIESARGYLDPDDNTAQQSLNSLKLAKAEPAALIRQIAEVWNPFQVYWHVVEDTTWPFLHRYSRR